MAALQDKLKVAMEVVQTASGVYASVLIILIMTNPLCARAAAAATTIYGTNTTTTVRVQVLCRARWRQQPMQLMAQCQQLRTEWRGWGTRPMTQWTRCVCARACVRVRVVKLSEGRSMCVHVYEQVCRAT